MGNLNNNCSSKEMLCMFGHWKCVTSLHRVMLYKVFTFFSVCL